MKRITLILVTTAFAVFMFAAGVSADGKKHRGLKGVYNMSASGSCLHSKLGFTPVGNKFVPRTPDDGEVPVVWAASANPTGIWIFKPNGTGSAEGINYIIDFPPGSPSDFPSAFSGSIAPKVRDTPFKIKEFTYEITHNGRIIVKVIPGIFELEGMVSLNRKTITLLSANQFFGPIVNNRPTAICNFSRVLIRVQKNVKDDD